MTLEISFPCFILASKQVRVLLAILAADSITFSARSHSTINISEDYNIYNKKIIIKKVEDN
jgi:hypothetical protein